ncbi:LCP family protein [Tepidibacillus sp. LV47]|uniref:LCP family protein n=1 Tax=Tepidibacillus sp. LV47 TaxID=3398228 RepID=UPI003AB09CFD
MTNNLGENKSRKNKRKSNIKKKMLWGLVGLLIIVGSIIGYAYYKISHTMNKMYQPIKRERSNVNASDKPEYVKTFLILGTDQRPGDKGRTDGIILLIMNDKSKKITLTSIPRDTYVEIAGTGKKTKINAAYPLKGIPGSIATVENFTNIPIDHYIWFNMEGFKKAIDAIGGIRVDVDHNVAVGVTKQFGHAPLPEGKNVLLNGDQALVFSRFRYDSKGDFGRNDRQQEVLKAFLDQSKNIRSPIKINGILDAFSNDVRMDIPKSEIYSLAMDLNDYSSNQVEQVKYKATTGTVNGVSYVFISDEERNRVTEILKERMK